VAAKNDMDAQKYKIGYYRPKITKANEKVKTQRN